MVDAALKIWKLNAFLPKIDALKLFQVQLLSENLLTMDGPTLENTIGAAFRAKDILQHFLQPPNEANL